MDRTRDLAGRYKAAIQPDESGFPIYPWSEASDYICVPRSILKSVVLAEENDLPMAQNDELLGRPRPVVSAGGKVSQTTLQVLGATASQMNAIQHCMDDAFSLFHALEETHTRAAAPQFSGTALNCMAVKTESFPAEGIELEKKLELQIQQILGTEQGSIFWDQAHADLAFHLNNFGRAERTDGYGL